MDAVDRKIVAELTRDGRVTLNDLAGRISLSRESVSRRLRGLLSDSGVRVVGVVHPSVLGEVVMAHVVVTAAEPADRIASLVAQENNVPFVSLAIGSMALTAEIRARDYGEFVQVLGRIRRAPGVVGADVSFYDMLLVDVLPQTASTSYKPDDIDLSLITSLRQNGRASYSALASAAGVSVGTARSRTLKLLEDGVVRIGVIDNLRSRSGQLRVGVGIKVRGSSHEVAEAFASVQTVSFLATSVGFFDLVATLESTSTEAVMTSIDKLRAHPDVVNCETWGHVQVVKEQH